MKDVRVLHSTVRDRFASLYSGDYLQDFHQQQLAQIGKKYKIHTDTKGKYVEIFNNNVKKKSTVIRLPDPFTKNKSSNELFNIGRAIYCVYW